jgi:fructokinase
MEGNPKVLCIGEMLWDCLADQSAASAAEVQSWTRYAGGAPANVACALTRLGTPASFIGCLGSDEPGYTLVQLLQRLGVDTTGVQFHPTLPTRQIEVLWLPGGDRQFGGFHGLPTTDFADTQLQANRLPIHRFDQADFLVLGTLGLAYPATRSAIQQALQIAEQTYLKILLDVNWRPMFWPDSALAQPLIWELLPQIDFLKLTVEEAGWLFGTADPSAISRQVGNLEGVFVTAGAAGCCYELSGYQGSVPAFPVEAEDTTGAGDSFVAGLVHGLCQKGLPALSADPTVAQAIVTYASAVAALTTLRLGAIDAQPTAAEVEAFLWLQQTPG